MLENALTLLKDHWSKLVGLTVGFIPVLWGIYRARREWRKREFMNRFSVSLNVLRPDPNGTMLWIPAAGEYDLEEVFHRNRLAVKIVRRAACATTPEEPFLVTIPEDDRASILNEVANRVEVMLREGSFAALAGLPVRFVPLVLGLTCEKGADVRIRKIRAMVVEESLLRGIDQITEVRFDKPHHVVRIQTLRHMAKLYADKPDLFTRLVVALRIPEAATVGPPELCHLVSASSTQSPTEEEAGLGTGTTAAAGASPSHSAARHRGQTRPNAIAQQPGQPQRRNVSESHDAGPVCCSASFGHSEKSLEIHITADSHVGEAPPTSPAGAAPLHRNVARRVLRRAVFLAVSFASAGAVLGRLLNADGGMMLGGALGAVLGALGAVVVSSYAWLLATPGKGAVRCGALFAGIMISLVLVALVESGQGRAGMEHALMVALMAGGMGGVGGAAFGAFLGWVAGPIFREMVQEIDAKASRTNRST